MPAFATTIQPPEAHAGRVPIFRDGSWQLADDHRGETWWRADGVPVMVQTIGDPLADGLQAEPPLAVAVANRIAEAWSDLQRRVAVATVMVTTGAGTHHYGLDAVTQDNMQKALLGVLSGVSPNPRPWTPKGALAPIAITHDEVKAIAGAVGLAYEAHVQAYLAHKRAIAALPTAAAVSAYDLTQGWPA